MPSTQRFEGTSLEELLEDVRDQFGADVTIAEANKIRKGGVGGFFAKEVFEVVVEVDENAPAAVTAGSGRSAPRSLLDLVDAVDDGPPMLDRRSHSSADAGSVQAGPPTASDALASDATVRDLLAKTAGAPLPDDRLDGRPDEGVAGLLSRMAERNLQPPEHAPAPANAMSTDGAAFGDVLRRIASSTRTEDRIDDAPIVFDDGADEPFRPYAATLPARQTKKVSEPLAQAATTPTTLERSPVEMTDRAEHSLAPDQSGSMETAPRGLRVRPDSACVPIVAVDADALGRLGVPERYRSSMVTNRDRIGSLVELAQSFPTAPMLPDHAGAVIAVVGDRVAMMRAITWVQDALGLSPEHLMLASPTDRGVFPEERRLCSAEDAGSRRQGWRRRTRPTLVAIDQPVGLQATAWTRHVLDALDLQAVWGVTDAGRKPEDITMWAERIGGVDALAVDGTSDTSSPASVLTTGIPVALLDGASATPARWAAVLDDRLAA